ncbi:hypothetical protein RRG08_032966 [Elysia crispata]|uniref:Uncharacterized protein n=1 Tax=Elysia crispata TaxID=231223 RepID=A0AAE1D4C4_9GAST|nr:hypothetical protein RRG08_032966 [Elysia crispata]
MCGWQTNQVVTPGEIGGLSNASTGADSVSLVFDQAAISVAVPVVWVWLTAAWCESNQLVQVNAGSTPLDSLVCPCEAHQKA